MVTAQEEKTRGITIWLKPAVIEWLKAEQERTGVPVSTQIRKLVMDLMDDRTRAPRK